MKIMYIHGFGSSAESGTVKRLRELLPDAVVVADDVPLQPQDAIAMLHEMADRENPDIIIGTSMGGMYAEQLHGYDRILVNPAFQIADTMKEHGMMGNQTYFNRRRDGVQQFVVTNALVKDFRTISEQCFQHPDPEHVWGLFGDRDPVVHTRSLFLEHYPRAINFHGEHRLNEHTLINYIVPLIRRIDKAQRGVSDPIILIDFSCLSDSHGNPASSMLKTYYQLIADYDVRILAPSPSAHPEQTTSVMNWVEEHISAPAHDTVIFCNDTAILMADYLITRNATADFMGSVVEFGSEGMKTWEDVATYFSRLGGQ